MRTHLLTFMVVSALSHAVGVAGCAQPPLGDDVEMRGADALSSPPSSARVVAPEDLATLGKIRDAYLAAPSLRRASIPTDSQNWLIRQFPPEAAVFTVPNVQAPGPLIPGTRAAPAPVAAPPSAVYAIELRRVRSSNPSRSELSTEVRFYTFYVEPQRRTPYMRYHGCARWAEPVLPEQAPRWFAPTENGEVELASEGTGVARPEPN